ncbi:lysozyme inhibitor LprI family protein [Herbaspirillum sp. RV1423]|uniref:lysozyme inhibitor LprI family protein n=1 Tax=Herbaspirillum sp. RV1423 TaxID=1443993 RepID=UPI00054DF5F6|nr:lysozyme inhibitor LprI family protein [Herbaspirillum sp. RV1423]
MLLKCATRLLFLIFFFPMSSAFAFSDETIAACSKSGEPDYLARYEDYDNTCSRMQLDELNSEMTTVYDLLMRELDNPDCCDSRDIQSAKMNAVESQKNWLAYRKAECDGNAETISNGTLTRRFYLDCMLALTGRRINDLMYWGAVYLGEKYKRKTTWPLPDEAR